MGPPSTKRGRRGGVGGHEYISLDGLRIDGRRENEVRKIRCGFGVLAGADGSAYYEQGHTRVLAGVYGPREPSRQRGGEGEGDRAVIRCEISSASFASASRKKARKGGMVGVGLVVQRVFEGVILSDTYAKSQIDIYVQVLENDGALTVAAINAATLALVNAGIAMMDLVIACSAGFVDEVPITDPNSLESGAGADRPELTVAVLPHSNRICTCLLDRRLQDSQAFSKALDSATNGTKQICAILEYELRTHSLSLLDSRGLVAI